MCNLSSFWILQEMQGIVIGLHWIIENPKFNKLKENQLEMKCCVSKWAIWAVPRKNQEQIFLALYIFF